jgi:hypothetical protein
VPSKIIVTFLADEKTMSNRIVFTECHFANGVHAGSKRKTNLPGKDFDMGSDAYSGTCLPARKRP